MNDSAAIPSTLKSFNVLTISVAFRFSENIIRAMNLRPKLLRLLITMLCLRKVDFLQNINSMRVKPVLRTVVICTVIIEQRVPKNVKVRKNNKQLKNQVVKIIITSIFSKHNSPKQTHSSKKVFYYTPVRLDIIIEKSLLYSKTSTVCVFCGCIARQNSATLWYLFSH